MAKYHCSGYYFQTNLAPAFSNDTALMQVQKPIADGSISNIQDEKGIEEILNMDSLNIELVNCNE